MSSTTSKGMGTKVSIKCGKCDSSLKPKEKAIQCSACSTKFHLSCQDVSEAKYDFLKDEDNGVLWFCYICRITTRGIINKLANIEMRLQTVEAERKKGQDEIKVLNNQVKKLEKRCGDLEGEIQQLSDFKKHCEESNEKMMQTMSNIRRDLYKEHDRNLSLQARLDELDQRRRDNNVRLVGLKENEDDDIIASQLIKLGGKSGTSVEDICSISRMGKKKEGKPRDLLVQFVSKQKRDVFYAMRKNTPKDEENKKVYINEDLTESRAKLFYDARRMVRRNKLHGTWSQNGSIMVKVKENDNPCAIHNHQELASLMRYVTSDSDSIESVLSYTSDIFEYNSDVSM